MRNFRGFRRCSRLKKGGNLSFAEEDFRDVFAENYKSAEENSEDIVRQVLEEVEKGSIKKVTQEEAERDHGGRLAIAALGAVPKELGSSVVRVVHDGSYSVDVNHRIKVRDRMRFPSVDDASGILMQSKMRSRRWEEVFASRCYTMWREHTSWFL